MSSPAKKVYAISKKNRRKIVEKGKARIKHKRLRKRNTTVYCDLWNISSRPMFFFFFRFRMHAPVVRIVAAQASCVIG
jgi:hypothetical protein